MVGSQYEGALGAFATVAFAAAFARDRAPAAEVTNFADLGDDLVAEPPRIRDGRVAPGRAGPRHRGRRGPAASTRVDG